MPVTITPSFDERSPIYEQIVAQFCRSLIKGELLPADRIPSIREVAMQLQVNTNTVQRAYQEMERRQLIYSKRGTGYFITEGKDMVQGIKNEMVQEAVERFLEEMRALGFSDDEISTTVAAGIKSRDSNAKGGAK